MARILHVAALLVVLAVTATRGQDCIHPYTAIGGYCIYIDPFETGTFDEIRALCKSHSGDIIWFEAGLDCDLYRDLIDHIHSNSLHEHDYWMGVTDNGHEGDWRFVKTNQVVRLGAPFWWVNSPSEATNKNCAIMQKSVGYYFVDVACNVATYSAICRKA
ncbi:perlucin-like protein [Penaeus monodon]|uniref:perlucin-like protein n=1 Tax=Penaeus monodon TaxID=6687 RepID=UPI0018A74D6E|nr:perlucin-like protein [Penaeus monodon]